MKLSVKDRIVIGELFPKESNIITQSVIKAIAEKVAIGKEEQQVIGMKSTPAGYTWDGDLAQDKEIEIDKVELAVLKEQVQRFDDQKKVTLELLPLCLKIKNASNE